MENGKGGAAMLILIIIAAICLLLGILFMANAKALDKFSKAMNKVVISSSPGSKKQAKGTGIFLIIFAGILFFIALKLGR